MKRKRISADGNTETAYANTYQLLGLNLWNIVNKALGRVISRIVVEVVKKGFSLD